MNDITKIERLTARRITGCDAGIEWAETRYPSQEEMLQKINELIDAVNRLNGTHVDQKQLWIRLRTLFMCNDPALMEQQFLEREFPSEEAVLNSNKEYVRSIIKHELTTEAIVLTHVPEASCLFEHKHTIL